MQVPIIASTSRSWRCSLLDSCHMPSFTSKRLKMFVGNVPLNHSHTENIITVALTISVREINGIICLDACKCRAAAAAVHVWSSDLCHFNISPYCDRCHCIRIHIRIGKVSISPVSSVSGETVTSKILWTFWTWRLHE